MSKSAGLLMYRRAPHGCLQVLLAHPGGPYWRGKDAGAWTIPKGEYVAPEEPLAAALREWGEETGFDASPPFMPLGEVAQKSGKRVSAWAFAGDCDPGAMRCNTFEIEWPPRSGRMQSFPEIDRLAWFGLDEARQRIHAAQAAFLDRLERAL
ncbi:NUDIX domain-containing protein [Ramlibacter solisilvae]|uniref:NUDIX hydrolase n=1 Tax=Ramlibacter tataouinensis TaxID=94132 RepID=A0A127JXU5_9BURK|nr:NUDIX domain-containing protein [Ramlibacter tataouinensis]AMO24800.1 NUDIX hydrolase [Ramlibacter tataouinensis]